MFGLEEQKNKKKAEEFVFDLEKELKISKTNKELKARIEGRVQKLKEILREGENREDFDLLGAILHGYTSLLKVMSRFVATK